MKISTKTRYGTRFLLHLALHGGSAPVPLSEIAKEQEISLKYLWNIASVLKSAGIVKTTVGAGGGFVLAVPPYRISLHDVFAAFDGKVSLVHCVHNAAACRRSPGCAARDAWRAINAGLEKSMMSVTIADIMRGHKRKSRAKNNSR
jgi:Rrf2 family protein